MTERGGSTEWHTPAPMLAFAKPNEIPIDQYGVNDWIAEPKIDGMRVTFRVKDGETMAWSRPGPGRPHGLQKQLTAEILADVCRLPNGVYDGELAPSGCASWPVSTVDKSQKMIFVFDVLETLGNEVMRQPWKVRRQLLELACTEGPGLTVVPVVPCTNAEYDAELDRGGEGLMLKTQRSIYRPGGRTKEWLKVKPTELAVLKLIGYVAAIRGPHATMLLEDKDRGQITVSTPGPILEQADRGADLLGRPVVVKYQNRTDPSERCPAGSYRHPRVHLDKTIGAWKRG